MRRAWIKAALIARVVIAVYIGAALVLGLLPVNASFRQTADGITIFVRTNGVHTDLVLPVKTSEINWAEHFAQAHFAGPVSQMTYIGFGWGDRDFYLQTRTWADIRPLQALTAFMGLKPTVLHVHYMEPRFFVGERVALMISTEHYVQLVSYVTASLRRDTTGAVVPIANAAYGATDAFYDAHGSYSAISTCNDWVRQGLSRGGIRTARWSPFDIALLFQLRAVGER